MGILRKSSIGLVYCCKEYVKEIGRHRFKSLAVVIQRLDIKVNKLGACDWTMLCPWARSLGFCCFLEPVGLSEIWLCLLGRMIWQRQIRLN